MFENVFFQPLHVYILLICLWINAASADPQTNKNKTFFSLYRLRNHFSSFFCSVSFVNPFNTVGDTHTMYTDYSALNKSMKLHLKDIKFLKKSQFCTRVVSVLHLRYEVVSVDLLCNFFHFFNGAVLQAVFDVGPQRTRKQNGILGNQSYLHNESKFNTTILVQCLLSKLKLGFYPCGTP